MTSYSDLRAKEGSPPPPLRAPPPPPPPPPPLIGYIDILFLARMQKLRSPSSENPEPSKVLSVMSGVWSTTRLSCFAQLSVKRSSVSMGYRGHRNIIEGEFSAEKPDQSNGLPLKPGAGQNIAFHASPTAGIICLSSAFLYGSVNFILFFTSFFRRSLACVLNCESAPICDFMISLALRHTSAVDWA